MILFHSQVKPRLVSGERKLSNQNQHLFDEGVEEDWDSEETLLSTLLLLLQRVDKEEIELTEEEERRWCTFMNLKRRVNKVTRSLASKMVTRGGDLVGFSCSFFFFLFCFIFRIPLTTNFSQCHKIFWPELFGKLSITWPPYSET